MADIDSNLPTRDSSDGTDGQSAPPIVQQVGGIDGSGNLQAMSVDTSGKININDISGTVSLPTGAATSALQTTGNSSLSSIDGKLTTKSGALATNVISNGGGIEGALTVGTSAVLVAVSGTNLVNRINATLYNNSLVFMYWGYRNTVTTSTGTPIQPGQSVQWDVGPSTNIYVIAGTSSNNARITETAS